MNMTTFASSTETKGYDNGTYLSYHEAIDLALVFVCQNIDSSELWNHNTYIYDSYTLKNLDSVIDSFVFVLMTDGMRTGYVVVSVDENTPAISEFSYSDNPVFESSLNKLSVEKLSMKNLSESENRSLIHNGPFEYYILDEGILYDKNENKVEKEEIKKIELPFNTKNKELKKLFKKYFKEANLAYGVLPGQVDDYQISDRLLYLSSRYGSYTYLSGKSLTGFPSLLQKDYGSSSDNDCTLVSITAISKWYYTLGKTGVPASTYTIYSDVLAKATALGYTPSGGSMPNIIDDIVVNSFNKWGYSSTTASNLVTYSFSTFKSEIDNNRPMLLNILNGPYMLHTVSLFGYMRYDVADFLMVKDNWTTSTMYLHYDLLYADIGTTTKIIVN